MKTTYRIEARFKYLPNAFVDWIDATSHGEAENQWRIEYARFCGPERIKEAELSIRPATEHEAALING